MPSKKFLEEQKRKLEQEKIGLENELKGFAKQVSRPEGNWKTQFPDFGIKTADPSEEEDQVEEYEATLPVEYTLETQLQKVKNALMRIERGVYGTCQKCGKKIKIKKLKANPEAELCIKCTEKEGSRKT